MHRLILAGGGHAQLSVLTALAEKKPDIETILVTPSPFQIYSGMLPGWMAGHYTLDECCIDLRPLAANAGAKLIVASIVGIDAKQRSVELPNGSRLDYDTLSIDIGSETNIAWAHTADERLLPIKPLEKFTALWPQIIAAAERNNRYQLIVVGGGAAGVELAFAARQAFSTHAIQAQVTLVASERGLLPNHAASVIRYAKKLLIQRGVVLQQSHAIYDSAGLKLSSGQLLQADAIIAATGARAAEWLENTDLALDEQGYLLVDSHQRSISHREVFAAGDVCMRKDIRLSRAGVHAVFSGPILANNLLAHSTGQAMQQYRPRKKSLYLLATGPKHAIASWGWFSAQGYWVWRWKDWIDRAFVRKYRIT